MALRREVLAALATLPVAGCGFHPLYMPTASGHAGPATRELAAVAVGVMSDRVGQVLRQELQARFARDQNGVPPRYDLGLDYSISGEALGIRGDSSATRLRLIARATWRLLARPEGGQPLATGQARAVDQVNVFDEQFFAADLGNDAAQLRLARTIADEITQQIALYFTRAHKLG